MQLVQTGPLCNGPQGIPGRDSQGRPSGPQGVGAFHAASNYPPIFVLNFTKEKLLGINQISEPPILYDLRVLVGVGVFLILAFEQSSMDETEVEEGGRVHL